MKRIAPYLAAIILCATCSAVYALYGVNDEGQWPASWPKELEPLRKQSRTLNGPMEPTNHYAIPFTAREQFEAAWPHLLKVKGKSTPIRLKRGPNFFLGGKQLAGVVVHMSPTGTVPETPISIDLIVDGAIIDLNRIPLPADTSIIDERFKDDDKNKAGGKTPGGSGGNTASPSQPAAP